MSRERDPLFLFARVAIGRAGVAEAECGARQHSLADYRQSGNGGEAQIFDIHSNSGGSEFRSTSTHRGFRRTARQVLDRSSHGHDCFSYSLMCSYEGSPLIRAR